jgi:hypothetical protein
MSWQAWVIWAYISVGSFVVGYLLSCSLRRRMPVTFCLAAIASIAVHAALAWMLLDLAGVEL